MADPILLRSLGYIIVAAGIATLLTKRLQVPTIVAYIATGLVLGPATGVLVPDETINLISHVGIALLLFLVGLELSIDRIRDVGRVAVVAGLGQVVFTAAGGFGIALLTGFDALQSLFLAIAFTFSSTVVVVKLLTQKRELNALYGRIAVGIFLVQDIVVILVLTFLAGLGRGEAVRAAGVLRDFAAAFGGMALLLMAATLAARFVLPRLFGWAAVSAETLFIWSLCWLFAFVIAAEQLHLSPEIGAFLAGISLAQLPFNHELSRRVQPLINFFLAVFFVTIGLQMELAAALANWLPATILIVFVLLGKPLLFMLIIRRMGYDERTSFLTSITVAQTSEFSFILAAAAAGLGLIDTGIVAVIAVVGLVTIGASSFMIVYNHDLWARVRGGDWLHFFRGPAAPLPPTTVPAARAIVPAASLRDHVIVIGMNSLGHRLVRELAATGEAVVAIDTDATKLAGLPAHTLVGDVQYLSLLEEAGLAEAKLLVSTLRIEDTNNMLAYHARRMGVPTSIHGFDRSVLTDLREIGVSHLMISSNDGIRRILREIAREGLIR